MAVPTSIADLSSTISNNSPAGPDSIGTALDDYFRAGYGILKQMVSQGTDVASASTITLPNDGHSFLVTGGTTITAIADSWVGRAAILRFAGTLQLTHNGSSFILPGSANISTAAGDFAMFLQSAAGVWRCAFYGRADGSALISNSFSGGTVPNATTFSDTVTFNGNISANSRTVSPTELGYVDGVTDYIQTQLNGKQSTITGAATTIAGADLTASRALASDGSGKVAVSAVTATELGTLSGIGTTAISTQLAAKLTSTPTFGIQFSLDSGANGDFTLDQYATFGYTINSAVYQTASGTITAAVKIEGSAVTGLSALSLTSSEGGPTSATGGTVSAGNKVSVTLSSNSSATKVSIKLNCTRT